MTSATAEIITVPGDKTFFPSEYFCVIDNESLPVGILIPRLIANSLISFTALYNLVFSPILLAGHIQLALNETFVIPFLIGAQIILLNDFNKENFAPFFSSINETIGENPIDEAIPLFDVKSKAITPKLFNDVYFLEKNSKLKSLVKKHFNLFKHVGRINNIIEKKEIDKNSIQIIVLNEKITLKFNEDINLVSQKTTGIIEMKAKILNQNQELVFEGIQKYLVKKNI